MLAILVSRCLPSGQPIDLINVAFENPRVMRSAAPGTTFDVPDRLSAKLAVNELALLEPERSWRLVEVDVPYGEAEVERDRVLRLMKPSATVMDYVGQLQDELHKGPHLTVSPHQSIAMALYFAARGQGLYKGQPYRSEAKVVLSGLGADEVGRSFGAAVRRLYLNRFSVVMPDIVEHIRAIVRGQSCLKNCRWTWTESVSSYRQYWPIWRSYQALYRYPQHGPRRSLHRRQWP